MVECFFVKLNSMQRWGLDYLLGSSAVVLREYFYLKKKNVVKSLIVFGKSRTRSCWTDCNTGLQGFVVEKLWVVSGVFFDVESESGIRISLSRQDLETFEVMGSKNGVFRYFWGYVQGTRNFFGFFSNVIIWH